jgi:Tfp pilus assembly protein PilO
MAIQTGLEGKPWYVGLVVGALLAGALFAVGHFFYPNFKEQRAHIQTQDEKLGELQRKIQEGRAASRQLEQFRAEVLVLQTELDSLLRILPSRRNTADLLRRIRDLTQQGDFNLLRFTPAGFDDKDTFYSEWPIAISLEGGYHNLAEFFDRISRFSRIINIQDLKIAAVRSASANRTISASFSAVTFVYREEAEEPAEGDQAAAAGGNL